MWRKSFLVFLLSYWALKAALDSEKKTQTNTCFPEFTSPSLDSKTNVIMKGQNVSLICSNKNKSLQVTYSLFRRGKYLTSRSGKGEPVTFNLSITEDQELGPYKCKAKVSNCEKYSREFNFTFADPVTTPVLNVKVIQTKPDLYMTLHCISFNGSMPINYTFFAKGIAMSPVISTSVREPAEFNLTKNNTGELEEYSCEAKNKLPNHAKYSETFRMPSRGGDSCPLCLQLLLPGLLLVLVVIILILAFWTLPKYKARKAMRDKVPRHNGNIPMEAGIYANICENQADKESVPDLEPMPCVSTAQDEACNGGKTGYVYSEIIF
ncbi:allergin-1 isoform X2 [Rhinolophus sinicus]|uniref:allergin-1 isoform X2 n=1 Tax=Rhinolophus sinicus TaxID=89399 RepID=UPI003D7BD635